MCWAEIIDAAQKIVATAAYFAGACWVLWNYWQTHTARVQFRISGQRMMRNGLEHLVIRAELSNVGLARVKLAPRRCAVDVYAHRLPRTVPMVMRPRWEKPIATLALFETKQRLYMEPNGLVTDELLVALPKLNERFLRIDGYVESHNVPWRRNVAWRSRVVLQPLVLDGVPVLGESSKREESGKK
jgi:hypothetical protein